MPKPMKVFYDFEFLEEYGTVDPISVGFVREDGKELYLVFNDFNTLKVAKHGWLMRNVMPFIGHEEITGWVTGTGQPVKDLWITDPDAVDKQQARRRIMDFLSDIWPEFWAWYGAYDHVALCSLFGSMVDLPARFPMFTRDIRQMWEQAGRPEFPKQPAGTLHNALADARQNVVRYQFLEGLLEKE